MKQKIYNFETLEQNMSNFKVRDQLIDSFDTRGVENYYKQLEDYDEYKYRQREYRKQTDYIHSSNEIKEMTI
jgi:hypothetical protein